MFLIAFLPLYEGVPECHAKSVVVVKPTHYRLSAARKECRNVPTGSITLLLPPHVDVLQPGSDLYSIHRLLLVPPAL